MLIEDIPKHKRKFMKRPFWLLIAFLALAACGGSNKRILDNAEGVLHERPDSALRLLQTLDMNQVHSRKLQARYALLLSLAQDKCYIDVTNDSTAMVAVKYFSGTKDQYHLMLSWYSLGRVQKNAGRRAAAVVSFLEAESLAAGLGDDHYLGLIYRTISDLYGEQFDAFSAKKYYKLSAASFERSGEPRYRAYSLYSLALTHHFLREIAQRDSLFKVVEDYALAAPDAYLYSQLMLSKGEISLVASEGDVLSALELLRKGRLYARGRLTSHQASSFMTAFALTGQKDSAAIYHDMAWSLAKSASDSASIFTALYWIANHEHRFQEANEYLNAGREIEDRQVRYGENVALANTIADYHRFRLEQEQTEVRQERQLAFAGGVCVLLFVLWLLQRLRVKKLENREKDRIIAQKEERIQEDLERTKEILRETESLKDSQSEMLQALASSILGQLQMVKKWSNAYEGISKEEKDPYYYLDQDALERKQAIIRDFRESLDQMRNDQDWFVQLESLVNLHREKIMERVRAACSEQHNRKQKLTESDYRTLLLMFAGLPDKSIAFFLDMTYGAVRMRRSRYRNLFRQMGHSDAAYFLRSLDGED